MNFSCNSLVTSHGNIKNAIDDGFYQFIFLLYKFVSVEMDK